MTLRHITLGGLVGGLLLFGLCGCERMGSIPPDLDACILCEGSGKVECDICKGNDDGPQASCAKCHGTGETECAKCEGTGLPGRHRSSRIGQEEGDRNPFRGRAVTVDSGQKQGTGTWVSGDALHSWSESSAVEPGVSQMGNAGQAYFNPYSLSLRYNVRSPMPRSCAACSRLPWVIASVWRIASFSSRSSPTPARLPLT